MWGVGGLGGGGLGGLELVCSCYNLYSGLNDYLFKTCVTVQL